MGEERFSRSAIALALALSGCGGETNGSSSVCAGTEPCGGDVLGVWDITGACASEDVARLAMPFTEPECSGAASGARFDVTGTYEFREDGTGSVTGERSFSFTMRLTDACVRALGGIGVNESVCSQFETSLNESAASDPTSSLAGGTCSLSAGACSCRVLGRPQALSSGGAYRVEGSEIVDDTDGSRAGFCVEGDTLTLISEEDVDGQPVSLYITMRRR